MAEMTIRDTEPRTNPIPKIEDIEEIQADLDEFIAYYNVERTNQRRLCHPERK